MTDHDPTTHIIAKGLQPQHIEHLELALGVFATAYPGISFEIETDREKTEREDPHHGTTLDIDQESGPYDPSMVTWYVREDESRVAVVTQDNLIANAGDKKSDKSLAARSYNSVMRFSNFFPDIKQHLEVDMSSGRNQPILGIRAESADGLLSTIKERQDKMTNFGEKSLKFLEGYFAAMVPKPE